MDTFSSIEINFFALILVIIICLIGGYGIGYFLRKKLADLQIKESEELGKKIIAEAEKESATIIKSAEMEAKEEKLTLRLEFEKEVGDKRDELRQKESVLQQKQNDHQRIAEKAKKSEKDLELKKQELEQKEGKVEQKQTEYDNLIKEELVKLESISSYTAGEAKEEIKNRVIESAKLEAAKEVRKLEEEAKNTADDRARSLITQAVQRIASDHVAETTVSVVEIPNDEIKGRIIGREGRNIRALEQCTGIDLIIDDTPGAVVLSGFDPIRREVAKRALERLTQDGRIHPGRIEEVVAKCKKEINKEIREEGERALMDLGIEGLHPDIVKMLGRLKYRTSYTQNVLDHVKEVAWICGHMAAELGLDIDLAKRSGLLHDIGKAIDRQTDGTHTQLGVEIGQKYGFHEYVINSIASHHEDEEPTSPYAVMVSAGDTISASRPGARREIMETYVKRMGQLEEIGDSFKGVEKTYAIQAGREIRIIVLPEGITDDGACLLAKDVAQRIEKEVTYPGEIKITVVRESRFSEIAR
jgi:ribonuclease Y